MSNGSDFDYKFGVKNQWRKWIWNRISERLRIPTREAVVLYLAGAKDLDRGVALRNGFKNENLIAIDRDSHIVSALRKQSKLAVCADMIDVIWAWNWTLPVNVVFFDGCSGFGRKMCELSSALKYPAFDCSVFAINLMRGRDAFSNDFRRGINEKHRARALYKYLMGTSYGWVSRDTPSWMDADCAALWLSEANLMPAFDSYVSTSGQTFDSGVWRNMSLKEAAAYAPRMRAIANEYDSLALPHDGDNAAQREYRRGIPLRKLQYFDSWRRASQFIDYDGRKSDRQRVMDKFPELESVARRVSAVRAIRTMKMNATPN